MLLLDASVLVAFLAHDPAADRIGALLRESEPAIATLNLAEVIDVFGRRSPTGYAEARRAVEPLLAEVVAIRPLTQAVAWRPSCGSSVTTAAYVRFRWPTACSWRAPRRATRWPAPTPT